MLEFKWHVPGQPPQELVLRLHSRSGWIGRKHLLLAGRTIYRRGWFEGIESRFLDPHSGRRLELFLRRDDRSGHWRPVHSIEGVEIPEVNGTPPPPVVDPPRPLAIAIGFTYLAMLMALVTLSPIFSILNAVNLRHDDRRAVLTVVDPQAAPETLRIVPVELPVAVQGQPYRARLEAAGGRPPYIWSSERRGWPRGVGLDSASGELKFTSTDARDLSGTVTVSDAAGAQASAAFAIVVDPPTPPGESQPAIQTRSLPPAALGQAYSCVLEVRGGRPAPHDRPEAGRSGKVGEDRPEAGRTGQARVRYDWSLLGKRRLPQGLSLNPATGEIAGAPQTAGSFPLSIRVADRSYVAARDVEPWIIPAVVTAICLVGLLDMRRWAVGAYGVLILAQGALLAAGLLPISSAGWAIEVALCGLGAAYIGRMR